MCEEGVPTPDFTTDIEKAKIFFQHTRRVYCRTYLRGHSGKGIVVAHSPEELVPAPLYTAGIDGFRDEFRVHVANGEVIDTQMKKKKMGADANANIRNHDNGFVYCRDGVVCSDNMERASLAAIRALHLDFGGVDLVVMRGGDVPLVLEVNTACGLEGTTVDKYADAFRKYEI